MIVQSLESQRKKENKLQLSTNQAYEWSWLKTTDTRIEKVNQLDLKVGEFGDALKEALKHL